MLRRVALVVPIFTAFAACSSTPDTPPAPTDPDGFWATIKDNPSCVLSCASTTCVEPTPWTCPALGPWGAIPHDAACAGFDGKTFPTPASGKCKATDPSGDALAKAQVTQMPIVLPDGRRVAPAGTELVFEADGGFPSSMIPIGKTRYVAISDYGYQTHSIRVVDTTLLKTGGKAEVARITYAPPDGLDYGLTYLAQGKLLLASSGSPQDSILAYDFDENTGAIVANAQKTITLPMGTFPSGIDVSADGKTLLVGQAKDTKVLIVSTDAATYGQVKGSIDLGSKDVFTLRFDPFDPSGNTAYATLWTGVLSFDDASKMKLAKLDVAGKGASIITVGKAPEEIAFIDAQYMAVANALGDSISLVDRAAGKVALEVPTGTTNGATPSTLAFDPKNKLLYATLAGDNAVAVFAVDTTKPSLTPLGEFPSAWWPTGLLVDPSDATVFVLSGRGHGIGADAKQYLPSIANEALRMAGSIAAVPLMDAPTLATATKAVATQNAVSQITGYPTVDCQGAPYDFPIPQKPEDGPSAQIKHVFFIVRENKTFDGVMAGQPNVDVDNTLGLAPGNMDVIWPNLYKADSQFASMDNYYIDAEQSIQGHAWTVFGRSTDYTERRWINIWGRGEWDETSAPGVGDDTTPSEGNVFQFLTKSNVTVDNQGEFIGGLAIRDAQWPGGSTSGIVPDTLSACYEAWRLRVMCNPKDFTYSWLVNDHTFGYSAGKPNPAVMIATNDEGTGMYLDALSHSPFWPDSLVIVVEDDPSEGGDHVDVHRTIALLASPWVKRGYVSHAHYDLASMHKLISDIYGKPYRNSILQNAPLPLDVFTSTPDYTPFDYVPRKFSDMSCNPAGTSGSKAADRWDFSAPDEQPGLGAQVWDALHALPVHPK